MREITAYSIIEDRATIITADTYKEYFQTYAKAYLGKGGNKELTDVTIHERTKHFILTYTIDSAYCGDCDSEGITEGRCEGHGENHQEWIGYNLVEIHI